MRIENWLLKLKIGLKAYNDYLLLVLYLLAICIGDVYVFSLKERNEERTHEEI